MKDLKLGVKLGLGFGIVLLLAMVVAISGWQGLSGVVDRADKVQILTDLDEEMLLGRVGVRDYRLTKKPEDFQSALAHIEKVKDIATDARDKKFHDAVTLLSKIIFQLHPLLKLAK